MNAIVYPKCSTCKKAIKWFKDHDIEVNVRHIVEEPLTKDELQMIHTKLNEPIKKLFNTSGVKYRELGLKDKIPNMTNEECYELLASDGMLVKRPLIVDGDKVVVGFKEETYEKLWKN